MANVSFPWHGQNDWSYEYAVIGEAGSSAAPFSWRGDSGAAIFSRNGAWLGLIYGSQTKLNTTQPLTYIIPAEAIIQDIQTQAGSNNYEVRLKGESA